jgi:hypothetical protein
MVALLCLLPVLWPMLGFIAVVVEAKLGIFARIDYSVRPKEVEITRGELFFSILFGPLMFAIIMLFAMGIGLFAIWDWTSKFRDVVVFKIRNK